MPKYSEIINVSSDSEDELWDASSSEDEEILNACDSLCNSPRKEASSALFLADPSTPSTSRMVADLDKKLNMCYGEPGSSNGSPTNATASPFPSQKSDSLQNSVVSSGTEYGTRPQAESSPSRSRTASTPNMSINGVRSRSGSYATNSSRLSRIHQAHEASKANGSNSCHAPIAISSTTPSPSKPVTSDASQIRLPYDSDDPDVEMDEVERLVDTDTEYSIPSTRQNSLLSAGDTSILSLWSEVSPPSTPGSRKRSINQPEAGSSATPQKRRMTDKPQHTKPSTSTISRAATLPIIKSQSMYPPCEDENVFQASPGKPVVVHLPCPGASGPSTSFTSTSKAPRTPSPSRDPPPEISSEISEYFSFLNDVTGHKSGVSLIAHDGKIQKLMDAKHISRGVQFEIARGVSQGIWQWSDVTPEKLQLLEGSNYNSAWKVIYVMQSRDLPPMPSGNMEIWRELDRELKAKLENKGRGLGLMGHWEGVENWYGGQVQQIARLAKCTEGSQKYQVSLDKLECTRSYRFARFLGSVAIIQMRIPKDLVNKERDDIIKFLSGNFVLCGRVYRPFTSKDGKVYLMETNEDYERDPDPQQGDQYRISFRDFVDWHNPLHLNHKQPMSKWTTRWALGLSTSRPILEFAEEDIFYISDLTPHNLKEGEPAATEELLTDGCGLINSTALTIIGSSGVAKLPHRPVAIQGRIGGAKGMWLLHPDDKSASAKIWIRDSQKKIRLMPPLHRAHLILDLVCPARVTMPSRLSQQTVINLAHNGVPEESFNTLIEKELQAIIEPLTNWNDPHAMLTVAKAIDQAGHITGSRLQRVAGGSTRALGLGGGFHHDDAEDIEHDDTNDLLQPQIHSGRDNFSGSPLSLYESTYELIVAGFHPLKFEPLYNKMQKVVTFVTDAFVKNYHIPVSESVEAYIVPDPLGVLEEGQIYFRSSQNLSDPETGAVFSTVVGEVIVARNPTRLPSDMQKVTAVNHPALNEWYDVIIFSTKGERSLASFLAGGDYDGDTVMLHWSKLIINFFRTSPYSAQPPDLLSRNFIREVESVTEFGQRVSKSTVDESQSEFQRILLLGLMDAKIGIYSIFHDNAVYQFGYDHPLTIRLAYMFTTCLDSAKTGRRLNREIFKEDQKRYGRPRASCMVVQDKSEPRDPEYQTLPAPKRAPPLGTFILDSLVATGNALKKKHLCAYDDLQKKADWKPDRDLTKPFRDADSKAKEIQRQGFDGLVNELKVIKKHVDTIYDAYRVFWASPSKRGEKKKNSPDLARQFMQEPPEHLIPLTIYADRVKASYAYQLSENFALAVAFRDLCTIKAIASQHLPMTRSFAETMSIGPSFLRVLAAKGEE